MRCRCACSSCDKCGGELHRPTLVSESFNKLLKHGTQVGTSLPSERRKSPRIVLAASCGFMLGGHLPAGRLPVGACPRGYPPWPGRTVGDGPLAPARLLNGPLALAASPSGGPGSGSGIVGSGGFRHWQSACPQELGMPRSAACAAGTLSSLCPGQIQVRVAHMLNWTSRSRFCSGGGTGSAARHSSC